MKKVVVFGGGTGLSCLLSGLKQFPVDVTTIVTVSDNGSSTGQLKEELDIPAVGDIGKVLLSMANADEDLIDLLGYRFQKDGSLYNHPVRNILMAALIDLKGSLTDATKYMCKLLDIKGTVLPLSEDKIDLVGENDQRHHKFFGEVEVSKNIRHIKKLSYDHDIKVSSKVQKKITGADLIIFSPGSLYTSIIPHLIAPQVRDALEKTEAPIMYVSNLVSQPGETDDLTVSGHVKVLNQYMDKRKVDCVIANNGEVDQETADRYKNNENKNAVVLDREELKKLNVKLIEDDIIRLNEHGKIRHDELKTAFLIFSYLMRMK